MPASTREIGRRIKSVQSTKQITKAMELVASAKLRRAIEAAGKVRQYATGLEEALITLLQSTDTPIEHPLLAHRPVRTVLIVAYASNQGLAGSFNGSISRHLTTYAQEAKRKGQTLHAVVVGRKIEPALRQAGIPVIRTFHTLPRSPQPHDVLAIASVVTEAYRSTDYDEIHLLFTRYISGLHQETQTMQLMPLTWTTVDTPKTATPTLLEPNLETLLDQLIPQILSGRLYAGLLESLASEHANRRRAMRSATDNAESMIDRLRLTYNRVRQTAITTEIAEITGGAAALSQ